jgi:hypothetical protein
VSPVRAVGIEIEGEMTGQDEEHPYPDGQVQHPVIILVALAFYDPLHCAPEFLTNPETSR